MREELDLTEERLVGTQPLEAEVETVETESSTQRLQQAVEELLAWKAASQAREAIAWTPRLRNLAAQILLYVCEKQALGVRTEASYFQRLGLASEKVRGLADAMVTTPELIVRQADGVLTRRNQEVHPVSLEALDAEVASVQSVITPDMEKACRWECMVVKSYAAIKEAFPSQFK